MKDGSILDLPEPIRSETLASMGRTAEECAAYLEAMDAMTIEMGQRPRSTSPIMLDDDSNAEMTGT